MIYRPEDDKDEDLSAFYTRKQKVKHNQLKGEAEVLHDADRDCDAEDNFSYGKRGYDRPKNKPPAKELDIWEDSTWDKEKP
jgi:hypothetical protein